MLKASILVPVVRPEVAKICISAIKENVGIPETEYEIISFVDKDRIGCPKMVSLMTKCSSAENIMFLGEDCTPQKDFLFEALESMKQLPDGWGLVALNDGMHMKPGRDVKCKLACHWLANKKLLPLLGGDFFYTGYRHTAVDNELTIRCYDMGKFIFSEKSKIIHQPIDDDIHKWAFNKRERTYNNALLEYRIKNKWESLPKFDGERCIPKFMANKIKIYQHHLTRYNFALMYARGKTVLDAACGSGFGTNLLKDVTKDIMGVDVSPGAVDFARQNYGRCDFQWFNLETEFPDKNFDIVISFETIEHLINPSFFIENVKKHAKEILFSVPLQMPSEFHKQVYANLDDVKERIGKYFKNIDVFSQRGLNIKHGLDPKSKYIIIYATV